MIQKEKAFKLYNRISEKKPILPLRGHLDLTYRCFLNCVHCYCKGSEHDGRELSTEEWKKILDDLAAEGCFAVTFSGGDPMIRKDFLEIYDHAKRLGLLVTIFTSGYAINEKVIRHLLKSPPASIEITLNGIKKTTYESITRVPGSFWKVMQAIKLFKKHERTLRLILKSNCLKQNKDEVAKVKRFTDRLFKDLPRGRFKFKFDQMIYPRLNRDKTPCQYKLSFEELTALKSQDKDIWEQHQKGLSAKLRPSGKDPGLLYHCTSWTEGFFINPFGELRLCDWLKEPHYDLKEFSFAESFFTLAKEFKEKRFSTDSKCADCGLRQLCVWCPGRAYLETGDIENPVEEYCVLARKAYDARRRAGGLKKGKVLTEGGIDVFAKTENRKPKT